MYNYLILGLFIFLTSCANNPFGSYTSSMRKPLIALKNGDINKAYSTLSNNNNFLRYLEHGTMLRMDNQYMSSNKDFINAQSYVDAWSRSFHNGSLGLTSDTFAMSMINDKVVDYAAKDYEKVMIPTYKALNYLAINDIDSARVEITRMYNLENIIADYKEQLYAKTKFEEDNNSNTKKFPRLSELQSSNSKDYDFATINSKAVLSLKNSYQNAFSHYLAGFIFEKLGEPSLARPGYIKAKQLNPNNLLVDQSINDIDNKNTTVSQTTDLLLVQEIGHAPQLKSVSFAIPFLTNNKKSACFNTITISFPELIKDETNYTDVKLTVDGNKLTPVIFTDFNLMAARYLHDNLPNIFLRNILRGTKDIILQQAICNNTGALASFATSIGTQLLGTSDERTWTTLPYQIYVSRLKVKRGVHVIRVSNANSFKELTLDLTNKNYAVLAWRVIGSSVYFSQ